MSREILPATKSKSHIKNYKNKPFKTVYTSKPFGIRSVTTNFLKHYSNRLFHVSPVMK
jgi:hypothetical protein